MEEEAKHGRRREIGKKYELRKKPDSIAFLILGR